MTGVKDCTPFRVLNHITNTPQLSTTSKGRPLKGPVHCKRMTSGLLNPLPMPRKLWISNGLCTATIRPLNRHDNIKAHTNIDNIWWFIKSTSDLSNILNHSYLFLLAISNRYRTSPHHFNRMDFSVNSLHSIEKKLKSEIARLMKRLMFPLLLIWIRKCFQISRVSDRCLNISVASSGNQIVMVLFLIWINCSSNDSFLWTFLQIINQKRRGIDVLSVNRSLFVAFQGFWKLFDCVFFNNHSDCITVGA